MQIGRTQTLLLTRFSAHGAYLCDAPSPNSSPTNPSQNDKAPLKASQAAPLETPKEITKEVLLPKKFLLPSHQIGDLLRVFVHSDSEDRPVATTQIPLAECNQIAILTIKSINTFGCFLDIGLDKDIFMPTKNPARFKQGQKVCVFITLDKQNRLIAKLGVKDHLTPLKNPKKRYKKLQAYAFENTPLGLGCIVENQHYGILYHNELKSKVPLLTPLEVLVKKVRTDGKLDLMLDYTTPIAALKEKLELEGFLDFNYDSSPQELQEAFGISKKLFKKTLSELIAQNLARIEGGKIVHNKN